MVTLPEVAKRQVEINREMVARRGDKTYEECVGMDMTAAQKEVFLVIDEWWKKWGFGPSIRDICEIRGKGGMGNTYDIINRLVKLGVVKKVKGKVRSVRPVYINFRELE